MILKKLLGLASAAVVLATTAVALGAQPASANVDIYITPGTHTVNGRQWKTTCEKYSSTVERCRTEITATQVVLKNGRYVSTTGWAFNNLTYKASPRAQWASNDLGRNAEWTSTDGRKWRTECDTPTTGRNGCRSYIWGTAISAKQTATGTQYVQTEGWMFNNMVRFTDDLYAVYEGFGSGTVTLPAGVTELYVDASHQGYRNFIVWGLGVNNERTELIANEIGDARAKTAVGRHEESFALDIKADGEWRIVVKPLSAAPTLPSHGFHGTGDEVLWYYGPARNMTLTHDGRRNFIVRQTSDRDFNLQANEIGAYSASRPFFAGPSLVEVIADGNWSIQ